MQPEKEILLTPHFICNGGGRRWLVVFMMVSCKEINDTSPEQCNKLAPNISDFLAICKEETKAVDYPNAGEIRENIPVYDGQILQTMSKATLMDEWNRCLLNGPGVLVIKQMYPDTSILDRAAMVFEKVIDEERKASTAKGDHFAPGGKNDRIWNSFQKLAIRDPEVFYHYFSNPLLATICEAWLGPYYQITAQVNIVRPDGKAQVPHRDYHLGFQRPETIRRFPIAMQIASQLLTLQGAIAHCDMPKESGPTRYLPHSQKFELGFLASHLDDFKEVFNDLYVQLPLRKGDAVFFSPALFHAAGSNESKDIYRMANLLQVSSAFGKSMETIDHLRLIIACYDNLQTHFITNGWTQEIENAIAVIGDGYPFPTNLDLDQPVGGLAPPSQQDLLREAIENGWAKEKLMHAARSQYMRRISVEG